MNFFNNIKIRLLYGFIFGILGLPIALLLGQLALWGVFALFKYVMFTDTVWPMWTRFVSLAALGITLIIQTAVNIWFGIKYGLKVEQQAENQVARRIARKLVFF